VTLNKERWKFIFKDQHKKEANEKSEKIKTFEVDHHLAICSIFKDGLVFLSLLKADVQRRKQDQMDKTKTLEVFIPVKIRNWYNIHESNEIFLG
jgi:hypothetical protein